MTAYYNERDPYAAQWLRNLIDAGHIAPGVVDERSIVDVTPEELFQYDQCHFFAGIGVWSHALRRAGWPDDRPIWTGSCPCQPFSAAGARRGVDDERHLWPHWQWLIAQCRPAVVVGEQVASKDGLGWLDLVSTDLEGEGYAFAAADLCAAGFSGAHIRQRLYFVGMGESYSISGSVRGNNRTIPDTASTYERATPIQRWDGCSDAHSGSDVRLADTDDDGPQGRVRGRQDAQREAIDGPAGPCGADSGANAPMLGRYAVDWLYCRDGKWRPVEPGAFPLVDAAPSRVGRLRAYGNGLDAETAQAFIECLL